MFIVDCDWKFLVNLFIIMHLSISPFSQYYKCSRKLALHTLLERRCITQNMPTKGIKSGTI